MNLIAGYKSQQEDQRIRSRLKGSTNRAVNVECQGKPLDLESDQIAIINIMSHRIGQHVEKPALIIIIVTDGQVAVKCEWDESL